MRIGNSDVELIIDHCSAELLLRTHRYYWLRYGVEMFGTAHPHHEWAYRHLVRRDIWRLGPLALYRIAMPRERP